MNIQWAREIERLLRNGQRQEASDQVKEAVATSGDDAYALLGQAMLSYYSYQYEESLKAATEALEASRLARDKLGEVNALGSQANALRRLDRHEESLKAATQALEASRLAEDKLGEGNALRTQADALGMLDRYEESLKAAEEAVDASRQAGSKLGEGNALLTQADALYMLGRNEESLKASTQALEGFRLAGDKLGDSIALKWQANALRMLGRNEESLKAATQALEESRLAESKIAEGSALRTQADALGMLFRHEESLKAATQASEAYRLAEDKLGEGNALRTQANALLMLDRNEESLKAATQALEAYRLAGDKYSECNALVNQVLALSELGQKNERERALRDLEALDPNLAKRMATYPLRPGWHQKVSGILKKKRERETRQREILHKNPQKPRLPDGYLGQFQVMRKWASYTTVQLMRPLADGQTCEQAHTGGGYFLWWQGWGLVIDPGLGFGEAYRIAGMQPRNISAVLATHHHIDHTGDMLPIIACLFEMNQGPLPQGVTNHQMDFLFSPGVFGAFANLVAHVDGVRSVQLVRQGESVEVDRPKEKPVVLAGVQTKHRDLTGRDDAGIGVRITLAGPDGATCSVGITGDTRLVPETALAFKDVDLLVVHIGSVYEYDVSNRADQPWHLGFSGVIQLLEETKKHSADEWNPLVLVSEWGEELAPDRTVICEEVAEVTRLKRVFPAEWQQRIALRPGEAQPICSRDDGEVAHHWHEAEDGQLVYLCTKHNHS